MPQDKGCNSSQHLGTVRDAAIAASQSLEVTDDPKAAAEQFYPDSISQNSKQKSLTRRTKSQSKQERMFEISKPLSICGCSR